MQQMLHMIQFMRLRKCPRGISPRHPILGLQLHILIYEQGPTNIANPPSDQKVTQTKYH